MTSATVFDPHPFDGSGKGAACEVCGSGRDAYVHSSEAAERGFSLVVRHVTAADTAEGSDSGG